MRIDYLAPPHHRCPECGKQHVGDINKYIAREGAAVALAATKRLRIISNVPLREWLPLLAVNVNEDDDFRGYSLTFESDTNGDAEDAVALAEECLQALVGAYQRHYGKAEGE